MTNDKNANVQTLGLTYGQAVGPRDDMRRVLRSLAITIAHKYGLPEDATLRELKDEAARWGLSEDVPVEVEREDTGRWLAHGTGAGVKVGDGI